MNLLFCGMLLFSLLCGCLTGKTQLLLPAALEGCGNALQLTLRLMAGYMFFCGLMEMVKALKAHEKLTRLLTPLLHLLMPGAKTPEMRNAVCLNLASNLLGLGNAATPTGIEAVRLLDEADTPDSRRAISMLLILNATGLQLIPTTVLTLRIAAKSAAPGRILLPTLLCTGVSTVAGVFFGLLLQKAERGRK